MIEEMLWTLSYGNETTCTFLITVACLGDSVANKHFPSRPKKKKEPNNTVHTISQVATWHGIITKRQHTVTAFQPRLRPAAKAPLESPLSNCHVISVKCKCLEAHSGLWAPGLGCSAPRPPPPAFLSRGCRDTTSLPYSPGPGRVTAASDGSQSKLAFLSVFNYKPKSHTRFCLNTEHAFGSS